MTVKIDGTKGTSSPGIYSNAAFTDTYTDGVVVDYTTGLGRISTGTSDGLAIYNGGVAGTEQMRIDSSDNVGIGTSSPIRKLEAIGSIGSTYSLANDVQIALIPNYSSTVNIINSTYNSTGSYLPLAFGTGGSERMRIDSSGNLLVGTTSVTPTTGGMALNGAGFIRTSRSTTSTASQIEFNNPNGAIGSIQTSGSSTAYNTSSDYRLKENIQPMQNALGVVAQLNPVTYTWKADGSDGQGFIAHELQAVVPDCVTGEKDAVDAEGNPVYQGIDTSFLVATLAKAIQELSAKNDALEARLIAAEEQIIALGVK